MKVSLIRVANGLLMMGLAMVLLCSTWIWVPVPDVGAVEEFRLGFLILGNGNLGVAFSTYSAYCKGCLVSKCDFIPEVEPSGLLILALQLGLILQRTILFSSVSIKFSQRRTFLFAIFFFLDFDASTSIMLIGKGNKGAMGRRNTVLMAE